MKRTEVSVEFWQGLLTSLLNAWVGLSKVLQGCNLVFHLLLMGMRKVPWEEPSNAHGLGLGLGRGAGTGIGIGIGIGTGTGTGNGTSTSQR